MNEAHLAYLSLGSNMQPEIHLLKGIELLQNHGTVKKISRAWESRSVGAGGPNYLNACLTLATTLGSAELKTRALLPIEAALGRQRGMDQFTPRTIDIDIAVSDEISLHDKYWDQVFVVIPFAEVYPEYQNPVTQERITETATRLRQAIWMEARPDVLDRLGPNITHHSS